MKQRNVIVLGATGTVGQRILSMLDGHPWMRVSAVAASERSAGKRYGEAARWHIDRPKPAWLDEMPIRPCEPNPSLDVAFSALDASVAGEIELAFASAGVAVVSNARNHRMEADIPLIVPEVNADQLRLIPEQRKRRGWKDGCIVTNPNCSTIGLVMALKPLHDAFGIDRVAVTTMQALSGAGYPGVPSADILDNVLPFIKGEEEKMQTEPLKILGDPDIRISAHCNRVSVSDGHLESVSVSLKRKASTEEVKRALSSFRSPIAHLRLPTLPERPLILHESDDRPQPRRDRDHGNGMTVTVGRVRPCAVLEHKFTVLSHNTVRGAAGAAVANAELLLQTGWVREISSAVRARSAAL